MPNPRYDDLPDGWSVEFADNATIFVQYRDVDVAAIWLPAHGSTYEPTITVPSTDQLDSARRMVERDGDTEPPSTEWAMADEETINLIDLCHIVDSIQAQLGVNRVEKERKDRLAAIVDAIRANGSDRERQLIEELDL